MSQKGVKKALCLSCNTLATPTCDCGLVASSTVNNNILIYTNDISLVKLVTIYYFSDGDVAHVTQDISLAKAKIKKLPL